MVQPFESDRAKAMLGFTRLAPGVALPLRVIPSRPVVWWRQLLIAAACLGVAAGARILAQPVLGDRVPFITFFPAVLIASIWGGWLGGATVLVLTPVLVGYVLPAMMAGYRLDGGSLAAFLIAGGMMVAAGALLAQSVRREIRAHAEQREAEEQLRALIGELGHRAKNGLNMVMAIAEQSSRQASSVADYRQRLLARLTALDHSQDLVTQASGGPIRFAELLGRVLAPFDLERFEIANSAQSVEIDRDTCLGLALLFHELATNAVKYGALSAPAGRVAIHCGVDEALAEATWREEGGPVVAEPKSEGFGTRLVSIALRQVGGETQLTFRPEGAECRMRFRTLAPEPA
jgi:two-component sensor histidine kinase